MKIKILFLIFVFIRLTVFSQLSDHFIIASAGDYFVGSNSTLSWTLGEPIIEYNTSRHHSLTQGFQQVFIQTVGINESPPGLTPESPHILVYPIPVTNVLHVDISSVASSAIFHLELYDLMGQLLYFKEVEGLQIHEKIPISHFVSNLFLLKLTNTISHEIKIVKVLKINQ